jgi:hypothetical protein
MARQLTGTEFAGTDDVEGAFSYRFADPDADHPTRMVWTERGETDVTLQAGGPVTVTTIVGEKRTLRPREGTVTLTASEDPLYVTGPVSDVTAGATVSLQASDRAIGETITVTASGAGAGEDLSLGIGGERYALDADATEITLPAMDRTGTRVIHGTLYAGDRPVGVLRTSLAVTTDVSATVVPTVSREGDRPGVLSVDVRSHTAAREFTITGVEWTLGNESGSQSLEATLAPGETRTIDVPASTLADWNVYDAKRGATLSVTFADREATTVNTSVAFDPIVRRSPTVDGDLAEYDDVPTISLSGQGTSTISDHGGPSDLGGDVWITWDDEHLYLAAAVSDDEHVQGNTGSSIWKGDSIQLGVTGTKEDSYRLFNLGHTPEGPQIYGITQPTKSDSRFVEAAAIETARDDGSGVTRYEVAIPWSEVPDSADAQSFRLSLLVNDNDGDGRKGYVEWGSGMGSGNDPEQFRILERVEGETLPEWASNAEPGGGRNGGGQSAGTSGDGADQGSSGSTGTGAPGFGVLVAAAALALLAGVARRRA